MRLVFAGTPEAALPPLRALLASGRHDVVAVVTRPDTVAGRGRHRRRSPVAELADENGIEVLAPHRAKDPEFLARLRALTPQCCPVVAYGALLPKVALDIPVHGWVNLHFSLLPAWRGAAPVHAAVAAGDAITGASTFRIVPALDAGPVFGVVTEPVGARDTTGELLQRLSRSGAELLLSTMDGIADGSLVAREQRGEPTYAGKVTVDDAHVDVGAPATRVDRLVRAMTPDPGAWVEFRGTRIKLFPVLPTGEDPGGPLPPGRLRVTKSGVLLGTATVPVRLTDVQAAGKRRIEATDWARGARIDTGERMT